MRPRSVRTWTSSTSSSTFVASPGYVDGSRLGLGFPIGSKSQIGAGIGHFTRAEWDIVAARDDDGAGSAGWRRQRGRD